MSDEAIDIDATAQREIDDVYGRVASSNYFEVLGVAAGADLETIRQAFHALSRKFHPDRFFGKNLGGFREKIERIFKRAVEASEVLSNAEKRAAYVQSNAFVRAAIKKAELQNAASAPKQSAEQAMREAERRNRLAKHPYLARVGKVQELVAKAQRHMTKEEFSLAFSSLNTALEIDPNHALAKSLLSQVRSGNEKNRAEAERFRAEEAYVNGDYAAALGSMRASLQLDHAQPDLALKFCQLIERQNGDLREVVSVAQKSLTEDAATVPLRMLLVRALEHLNMKALAAKQLDIATKIAPAHPDVKKHTKRRWPF